jgi:hypothetical protein
MLEFLREALAAKSAYVGALPAWVQLWMHFMQVVFGASLVFAWRYPEARALLASVTGALVAALVWGGLYGFSRLWGVWHLVFYTPFVVYLARRRRRISRGRVFRAWLAVATATMVISLVFDAVDVARYLAAGLTG